MLGFARSHRSTRLFETRTTVRQVLTGPTRPRVRVPEGLAHAADILLVLAIGVWRCADGAGLRTQNSDNFAQRCDQVIRQGRVLRLIAGCETPGGFFIAPGYIKGAEQAIPDTRHQTEVGIPVFFQIAVMGVIRLSDKVVYFA